ncbi:serine/threonine protein kinase [Robertmurraya yapensis]|uniref:Serine/threonine protein kinase n=1 Tax=Bacillus yapensis TaxID=2492960 RepID=A0A431WEN7_9BACI|nr:serine/threonine protein kinase [Bacillus yapensis]RTR34010.1 serine/threonine protein kinase [Bacillus yapensis]TKS97328.1 serine/threonine protein kinase [Bacillus yapensis]
MHTFNLDKISFQLKENRSFKWLTDLGEVFTVFDEQDPGNLCFGIEKDGQKKFVKFAGAKTMEYEGEPEDAVIRLKNSVSTYENLQHKQLIKLVDHFEVDHGYVMIFDWFDGECLHSHWSFPPPHKYTHPDSPFYRYKHLPIKQRLDSFKNILEFHVHVEKKGYVAVDFYDGSILYDFKNNVTKICDIDFYQKKLFFNNMGRMWGSERFMSPEEFEYGAVIDERTNVFNMGSIAFGLLGRELDHSFEKWDASQDLYDVVIKAVQKDRGHRYASVEEFYNTWLKVENYG